VIGVDDSRRAPVSARLGGAARRRNETARKRADAVSRPPQPRARAPDGHFQGAQGSRTSTAREADRSSENAPRNDRLMSGRVLTERMQNN